MQFSDQKLLSIAGGYVFTLIIAFLLTVSASDESTELLSKLAFHDKVVVESNKIKDQAFSKLSGVGSNFDSPQSRELLLAQAVPPANPNVIVQLGSPEFVNINVYGSSACKYDPLTIITYGVNICFSIRKSSVGYASSTAYLWNATTHVLTQAFYTDISCTSLYATNFVESLNLFTEGVCKHAVKFTITSTFSVPATDGYTTCYYPTSLTCFSSTTDDLSIGLSQPVYSSWITLADQYTDDAVTSYLTPCQEKSINSQKVSNAVNYSATVYVGDGVVYTPPATNKPYGACFPGSETVRLSNGLDIPISTVKIGDMVLSASLDGVTKFSEVVFVPHPSGGDFDIGHGIYVFVQLRTTTGADLKLTAGHIIPVSINCNASSTRFLAAIEVEPDMCLLLAADTGNGSRLDKVDYVRHDAKGYGYYTVVTEEELIVVNGVIVSPYGSNHPGSHAFYTIYRHMRRFLLGQQNSSGLDGAIMANVARFVGNALFSLITKVIMHLSTIYLWWLEDVLVGCGIL